jgi:hypothetical protein
VDYWGDYLCVVVLLELFATPLDGGFIVDRIIHWVLTNNF